LQNLSCGWLDVASGRERSLPLKVDIFAELKRRKNEELPEHLLAMDRRIENKSRALTAPGGARRLFLLRTS
jgi:hypothetical protein